MSLIRSWWTVFGWIFMALLVIALVFLIPGVICGILAQFFPIFFWPAVILILVGLDWLLWAFAILPLLFWDTLINFIGNWYRSGLGAAAKSALSDLSNSVNWLQQGARKFIRDGATFLGWLKSKIIG